MIRRWQFLLSALGSFLIAGAAAAHPHAWIDLRSRVLLDDDGRVHALEFAWLFDDYYTVLVAEELASGGEPTEGYLKEIAERNLANLEDHGYFTAITFDGEPLATGKVTRYETDVHDGRLWMRFELPLSTPVDPTAATFSFSVYDPTYYIEILHLEGEPILFSGQGAEHCLGTVRQPNPTMEQVSLAAALDRDETAGDNLGAVFAETIVVSCG